MIINRYSLEIKNEQIVMLPHGAEILSVAYVEGQIYLYALVDPDEPFEKRKIAVMSTYRQFEKATSMKFIGLVYLKYQYCSCGLEYHVFELL